MSRTFAALSVRNYRLYFTGAVISNVGTWLQRVAQDWLVLQLTHSGVALGIVTGLQFLPSLLLGPYAGVLADRMSKRTLLAIAQSAMGACALTLGLLDITGVVRTEHVMVIACLFGLASAFEAPTRQSFVLEMVGRDHLTNAVALNAASFNTGRLVGPAMAGLLIAWIGTGPVIVANGVSYAGVLLSLWLMRAAELHPADPVPRERGQLVAGIRYVWRRPELTMVLIAVTFAGTFGLNFQLTSALMATQVFGKDSTGYGVLGSVLAVGSLAGALLAARRRVTRPRLVIAATIGFALVEVLVALMPTYWSFLAMLPLLGVIQMTMMNSANATVQLGVEPGFRGRVMALYMTALFGGTALGGPVIGWLAEQFGPRWGLLGGGLLTLLGTVGAVALYTHRTRVRVHPHLLPRPHLDFSRTGPSRVHR